jgi:putative hemolysin
MFELFIIIICLLLNALLAGAEMAFVTVGKPRLREMTRTGNSDARRILSLRENPERTLSVIQVGITLVGGIAAAVGGASSEEVFEPILRGKLRLSEPFAEFIAVFLVVIPLTYFNVVIGELVPKALALRNPIKIILLCAKWLAICDQVLSPIVTALEWSTKKILKVFFWRTKPESSTIHSDTVELDQLSHQTRQYVLNLVGVEKKKIKDVFLLWEQVITISAGLSPDEVESTVLSSGHTRLPVVDQEGKVIGILNTKEFVAIRKTGETNWLKIIRPPVQVKEDDSLLRAFRQMQEKRSHLSIVYSQSSRVGIVTMEDILEEVMGDIYDEDDDGRIRKIFSTSVSHRKLNPKA